MPMAHKTSELNRKLDRVIFMAVSPKMEVSGEFAPWVDAGQHHFYGASPHELFDRFSLYFPFHFFWPTSNSNPPTLSCRLTRACGRAAIQRFLGALSSVGFFRHLTHQENAIP